MKFRTSAICAAVALTIFSSPSIAQSLTVDSIMSLAKAGLGDEAIVAKIKSDGAHFNLSVDEMLDLRGKGLSSAVIAAMIEAPKAAEPKLSMDSPDPMVPHPAGVYFLSGTDASAKMVKMNPTISNQAKTGGIFGYALTGGIASLSIKASIPNATAKLATSVRPTFYFFFDQSNNVEATNAWASGSNTTVSSPAEFSLIRLMEKKDRREARVGSANIGGAKTGVMDKDSIPFDYTEVRPGVYRINASEVSEPGEYGFIFGVTAGGGAGGAMTARIYDFSVN